MAAEDVCGLRLRLRLECRGHFDGACCDRGFGTRLNAVYDVVDGLFGSRANRCQMPAGLSPTWALEVKLEVRIWIWGVTITVEMQV